MSRPPSPESLALMPFRGYGNRQRLTFGGRVLERRGIVRVRDRDTVYDNLLKMYRRFFSRPGRGALVRARLREREFELRTDEDGLFRAVLVPGAEGPGPELEVDLELRSTAEKEAAKATIFVAPDSAELGVVSDIDDTVLRTDATDPVRMVRIVLFGNAHSRLPFSGVRAFYRALHEGRSGRAGNPFFYVSSSSWRIYDVMRDFLELHDMPRGPILLRNVRLSRRSLFGGSRHDHKLDRILEILDDHPGLRFVLIGDSGQRDAELYCEVVRRRPGRIAAVYLRDVLPTPRRRETIEEIARSIEEKGSELLLVDTTVDAARHAVEKGFIHEGALPSIERDEVRDEPKNPVAVLLVHTGRVLARLSRPRWRGRRSAAR